MSSNPDAEMAGRTTVASASGRPLSQNPDAVRKREARQTSKKTSSSSVGGRGGAEPSTTKGNPIPPSSPGAKMGEPLSPHEAERQLFYAHVGIAKVIRSEIDMSDLKEEFEVAGENYAYVANHMWTPLRVVIRFVAPVVLVAALLMIWGSMIAATPWMRRLQTWWSQRGEQRREEQAYQEAQKYTPEPPQMHVVEEAPNEAPQAPPPIPKRPAIVRRLGGIR